MDLIREVALCMLVISEFGSESVTSTAEAFLLVVIKLKCVLIICKQS